MKISDILFELERQFPKRRPNSEGYAKVKTALQEQLSALGHNVLTQKIPVYNFHISLLIYIIGSIAIIDLGYFHPMAGFLTGLVFFGLLFNEINRPFFARLKTVPGENLVVTIPARSKEIQKVVVVADLGTDSFIQPSPKISNRFYLITVFLLGLGAVICLGLSWLLSLKVLALVALIPVLGIIYLKLFGHTSDSTSSLKNCAVLTELAQILAKDQPFRTTVSFLFTASGSLNSGVLKVPAMFQTKLKFSYVVDLINLPDKRINIVSADGIIVPSKNHPLLVELLMEVAREKGIPVQEIKCNQMTAASPLKAAKIKTVSITNPLTEDPETDTQKDLRELLIGLIRKLDHT